VALDLVLTGRRVDAGEALRLGLVSRVVASEHLSEETERVACDLTSLDPEAVAALRRAVREGMDLSLEQGLRLESQLAASLRAGKGRESWPELLGQPPTPTLPLTPLLPSGEAGGGSPKGAE
jgi:enoyl-CoA hydratase/carnithine racemase